MCDMDIQSAILLTGALFSDAIAAVRRQLWAEAALSPSQPDTDREKVPRELFDRLADLACYPA
jgi:hypothetical protein